MPRYYNLGLAVLAVSWLAGCQDIERFQEIAPDSSVDNGTKQGTSDGSYEEVPDISIRFPSIDASLPDSLTSDSIISNSESCLEGLIHQVECETATACVGRREDICVQGIWREGECISLSIAYQARIGGVHNSFPQIAEAKIVGDKAFLATHSGPMYTGYILVDLTTNFPIGDFISLSSGDTYPVFDVSTRGAIIGYNGGNFSQLQYLDFASGNRYPLADQENPILGASISNNGTIVYVQESAQDRQRNVIAIYPDANGGYREPNFVTITGNSNLKTHLKLNSDGSMLAYAEYENGAERAVSVKVRDLQGRLLQEFPYEYPAISWVSWGDDKIGYNVVNVAGGHFGVIHNVQNGQFPVLETTVRGGPLLPAFLGNIMLRQPFLERDQSNTRLVMHNLVTHEEAPVADFAIASDKPFSNGSLYFVSNGDLYKCDLKPEWR